MGKRIFIIGFVASIYFIIIGVVCPFLVSSRDYVLLVSGFLLILVTAATVPFVFTLLFNREEEEKLK